VANEPSPPETRRVILRACKQVRRIFFVKDYAATFSGSGYLEQGLKRWFGAKTGLNRNIAALNRWGHARDRAQNVLALDHDNRDALAFVEAAEFALGGSGALPSVQTPPAPTQSPVSDQPTSFANGRYQVKRFLGEGGKKRVYLAQDTLLDREVAFALISRTRITREAQVMGRLGSHPHIVTVFDLGDIDSPP